MLRRVALAVSGAIGLAAVSVSPVLAASPPSPYTNGALVKFQGQSAVYLVKNDQLHWIMNGNLLHDLGYHWSDIHVFPTGVPRPITGMAVRFLQLSGHKTTYYLSPYGKLYQEPDPYPQFYNPPSPNPSNTYSVSALPSSVSPWIRGYMNSVVPSLPNGIVVGLPHQSPLYVYGSGHLHWIPSAAIFHAAGYSFSNVYLGGDPHLPGTAPWGDILPASPGTPKTLLRVVGTPRVYDLLNGTLHAIPSWSDFKNWGFSVNAIQPVHYLPYPIGSPLTSQPS